MFHLYQTYHFPTPISSLKTLGFLRAQGVTGWGGSLGFRWLILILLGFQRAPSGAPSLGNAEATGSTGFASGFRDDETTDDLGTRRCYQSTTEACLIV